MPGGNPGDGRWYVNVILKQEDFRMVTVNFNTFVPTDDRIPPVDNRVHNGGDGMSEYR